MAVEAQGVEGLRDFAKDLRKVDRELAKQLRVAHKTLAVKVADDAKAKANSVFGAHRSQARGIAGRGSQRKASIALNTGRTPRLLAAEFGAKRHFVYGQPILAAQMSRRVFPAWTGNRFVPGEGPAAGVGTAVHPTVRGWVESGRLADEYGDHIMEAMRPAFPEG